MAGCACCSGGGGGQTTPCCPSNPVPNALVFTPGPDSLLYGSVSSVNLTCCSWSDCSYSPGVGWLGVYPNYPDSSHKLCVWFCCDSGSSGGFFLNYDVALNATCCYQQFLNDGEACTSAQSSVRYFEQTSLSSCSPFSVRLAESSGGTRNYGTVTP